MVRLATSYTLSEIHVVSMSGLTGMHLLLDHGKQRWQSCLATVRTLLKIGTQGEERTMTMMMRENMMSTITILGDISHHIMTPAGSVTHKVDIMTEGQGLAVIAALAVKIWKIGPLMVMMMRN
jgi:hypothetical protein